MQLRPHQSRTVKAVADAWRARHRRALVYAPTGAGKTIIAASMMAAEPGRALFVAPWRELIGQTREKLAAFGLQAGTIMGDTRDVQDRLMVGSLETVRRLDALPPVDLVVVDEAHRATTELRTALLDRYPKARHLLLSATPWREREGGLRDLADTLITAATYAELFSAGYLVRPTLFAPSHAMGESAKLAYVVSEWFRVGPRPTVWFVGTVEESRATVELLKGRGVAAWHVDGTMPDGERDEAVTAAKAAGGVLCNVGCLMEGFDWPHCGCVVLRRCQSLSWWVQASGRAMRAAPGKASATILDPSGVVHRYGPPWADRAMSLDAEPRPVRLKDRAGIVFTPPPQNNFAAARELLAQWRGSITPAMVRAVGRTTGYGSAWVARELAQISGKAPGWLREGAESELRHDPLRQAKLAAWFD